MLCGIEHPSICRTDTELCRRTRDEKESFGSQVNWCQMNNVIRCEGVKSIAISIENFEISTDAES